MSVTPEPNPGTPLAPKQPHAKPNALRDVAVLLLIIVVIAGGVGGYLYWGVWGSVGKINYPSGLRAGVADTEKLAEGFKEDGDSLVAAPPADAKEQLDPEVLHFGVLDRPSKDDPDRHKKIWKEFGEHLARVTGKKVEVVEAPVGGESVVTEMKEGKLHVAALSTGTVPLAVTRAGFIPFASMGDDAGNFFMQMEILVRADTNIHSLKDLKDKTIVFGSFSSLTSFKAPLVLLWEQEKLLPGRDYKFAIDRSQAETIKGMLEGKHEVVAVANDLLRRVERDFKGEKTAYRSIHKSPDYPALSFGYIHRLKPDLAAKIKEAFSSFKFEGTGLEAAYAKIGQKRFVPVTYKKDFANVRAIDKALLELVTQNK